MYSKKYIVSTNGKSHGHPHKEVLAKILQNNFKQKKIYFNYPIALKEELESIIILLNLEMGSPF